MLNRYYEQELAGLKDLAVEFSRAHPTLAPLLGGASTDPDVERLLEGTAFLTGQIRQKIEDEFPEVVQTLAQLFFPHYLRPIPSATIVAFRPKAKLTERITVAVATQLASVPVDNLRCLFRTCYATTVDPTSIESCRLDQQPGQPPAVEIGFKIDGLDLGTFAPGDIRLFLSGGYADATRLYYLLQRYVKRIVVTAEGGEKFTLGPSAIRPVGFSAGQELIPYPSHSYPGYRILQEYLALPEKFLFLDLVGLSDWTARGEGNRFVVRFEMSDVPAWTPPIRPDQFCLNATPVVNLFSTDATPISLDHRKSDYPVRASGAPPSRYPVYTVDKVVGFRQGSAGQREYVPFEMFQGGEAGAKGGAYQTRVRPARIGTGVEVFLAVAYGANEPLGVSETLSLSVTVTDGVAPESLRLGDINAATDSSPESLSFGNIRPLTPHLLPPTRDALLWRLLAHLSINYLSVADADTLKALLRIYLFGDGEGREGRAGREAASYAAHSRRIDGIVRVESERETRLINGLPLRGQRVRIGLAAENFASEGDMFLFCQILDTFLAGYATVNAYTRLEMENIATGELVRWPARLGEGPLL